MFTTSTILDKYANLARSIRICQKYENRSAADELAEGLHGVLLADLHRDDGARAHLLHDVVVPSRHAQGARSSIITRQSKLIIIIEMSTPDSPFSALSKRSLTVSICRTLSDHSSDISKK